MTSAELTSLIWKLIIAIAPIIVSVVAKLITDMVAKMSTENRAKLEYWVDVFVKTAQMLEPDPQKRKEWVMEQIAKLYPDVDKEQLSALIEAVLAEIKLESGTDWKALAPDVSAPVA
ncbi:MAG TPA: hypothetical protein PLO19_07445 [Candidatus Cryosericum sp.]|nr:hypothetical protein [Candidatus Cryosericum sp.]